MGQVTALAIGVAKAPSPQMDSPDGVPVNAKQIAEGAHRVMSAYKKFGPFRFFPGQQLLLEGETPVRLGSRALAILAALVERPGELVSKDELTALVWPNTVVEESNLKVNVAALRRALGEGQPGRRYIATVSGRGYRFVAPVERAERGTESVPQSAAVERVHNLPASSTRTIGRADTIHALLRQLQRHRLVTLFEQAKWEAQPASEWLGDYGCKIDDVRYALN
jgi:DNA-binding winged helix-turn-helix (wHTH) protein